MSDFRLLPFQEEAADALTSAAMAWVSKASIDGPPRYGSTKIPFLGQLRAVTGAGKTPILAATTAGLGDALVIWTSKSSAVVEQTYANLRGKYRSLLPQHGVNIIRDVPTQRAWQDLLTSHRGLTIWLLTVASWNDQEAAATSGTEGARLNLHRPQPDLSGDRSPWDMLRTDLRRPLWIVSDESHNQTSTQLDQLGTLGPMGFLMASATPVENELFRQWADAAGSDMAWKRLGSAAVVKVHTRDVVEANLLKTTLEVMDFNSGTEESLDGALTSLEQVEEAIAAEDASVTPRVIYVVEKSNPSRGSTEPSRPLVIWRHLRSRGVPADEIAVYTDTKEMPTDAVRVNHLSRLHSRFRHIIFNQALQEGWDDPEAYVCYFDGLTKSVLRIRQIVGRVLRQPSRERYLAERLNTATVIMQVPSESYDTVLEGLRDELRIYAPENEPQFAPVKIKTRRQPLSAIPIKPQYAEVLSLPRRFLDAPDMGPVEAMVRSSGDRPYSEEDLLAAGVGRRSILELEQEDESGRQEHLEVIRSARTENGTLFKRRMQKANRNCSNAVHPDRYSGPMFRQWSCYGSVAQEDIGRLAASVVSYYEDRVGLGTEVDPKANRWTLGEHRPRSQERIAFARAAHAEYSKADFANADELQFAYALDRVGEGVWCRNSSSPGVGFGVPLPSKVDGGSSQFFPDYLWWINDVCWALDTTGRHLLDAKVRGKLLPIDAPRLALVVRGQVDLKSNAREGVDGWSLIRAREGLSPLIEYSESLDVLLRSLLTVR